MSDQRPESAKTPPAPSAPPAEAGGRRAAVWLAAALALAGVLWAAYWLIFLRGRESTDDAYVAGNQVRVAPRITGTVREILADNTMLVEAGQVLVRLDPTDAALALEKARADLADAARQRSALMAQRDRLAAMVEVREKELFMNQSDYLRRQKLRTGVSVTAEELDHAREQAAIAEANLQAARHELEAARRQLLDTPLADQPTVRQSADRLREAWLTLQRCEIRSPARGWVARRTAQVGTLVTPGTPLMVVVPPEEIWVEANFKEVQLQHLRSGQRATVKADFYGGEVVHQGRVVGLAAGTGGVFSLLPPENATGNWIKVVQRVPVRIGLDPAEVAAAPLKLGLSCLVEVDWRDSGTEAGAAPPPSSPRYETTALDHDPAEIDREIAAIIAANQTASAPQP